MALYKYAQFVQKSDALTFDAVALPGTRATYAGIYRCTSCGFEVPVRCGEPLPLEPHQQRAAGDEKIEWQLLVYAVHKK